jgi:hypothetical protein
LNRLIKISVKFLVVFAIICLPFLNGCQNNLSDEGISYIASDTLGTLLLDSQKDSIPINSNNFIKYINTYSSAYMMVGKYLNYESKSLLKFTNVNAGYDTMNVVSAKLFLRYSKVFFMDSGGVTSFNIYRLLKSYDYTTVTYDNFLSSDIGTSVLGTYTGTPMDTSLIAITLDNQAVKDWLKYATDTNYAVKNNGLVFLSNPNSTTIKSFYSSNSTLYPYVVAVLQQPTTGIIDTLTLDYHSSSVSLNYTPQINTIPGRIIIQNGIGIKDLINFSISKLPNKVIINQATLELKIDRANTFYSQGADTRLVAYSMTDTSTETYDGAFTSYPTDSNTYTIYITQAVQKWNYGSSVNLGLLLKNLYEYSNLDRYVFYGTDYPDVSKRPKFKIRYSIRR